MFNLFGADIVKSIENVAKEWIDTPEERAKASTLMVKVLDPNGLMRRQISSTVSKLYVVYILFMMFLGLMQAFGLSPMTPVGDTEVMAVSLAIDTLKELFLPITGTFSLITTASFGVQGMNSFKDK